MTKGQPKRAAADESYSVVADSVDEAIEASTAPRVGARRGRQINGRAVVALTLAGMLVAVGVGTYQFFNPATDANSAESVSAEMAVPASAADSADQGFSNRDNQASRNAVRSAINETVVDDTVRDREEQLDAQAEAVTAEVADVAVDERDRLMDEDLKLVAAQEKKLQEEAAEAQRRMEEARKAAQRAGLGKNLSEEELEKLSADLAVAVSGDGGALPVRAYTRIGAGFGARGHWSRYHTGQDFPAPTGTPVYAAASGVVLSPTAGRWAGINVVIQHGSLGSTLYAHLSRKVVQPGDAVKAGQLIGYVGTTGRSFGSHLHFEYYKLGVTPGKVYQASNPMTFLRSLGVDI